MSNDIKAGSRTNYENKSNHEAINTQQKKLLKLSPFMSSRIIEPLLSYYEYFISLGTGKFVYYSRENDDSIE